MCSGARPEETPGHARVAKRLADLRTCEIQHLLLGDLGAAERQVGVGCAHTHTMGCSGRGVCVFVSSVHGFLPVRSVNSTPVQHERHRVSKNASERSSQTHVPIASLKMRATLAICPPCPRSLRIQQKTAGHPGFGRRLAKRDRVRCPVNLLANTNLNVAVAAHLRCGGEKVERRLLPPFGANLVENQGHGRPRVRRHYFHDEGWVNFPLEFLPYACYAYKSAKAAAHTKTRSYTALHTHCFACVYRYAQENDALSCIRIG